MSWCVASKNYTKDDGTTLKVTLTDFNSSEVGWAGASALFALKMSSDNATESSKTFQTSDFINTSATIMYGLGGRFLLQVEASNQSSVDFIRSVATGMNLNKLSSL